MADCVGQQFGNYRLIRLLGQGGFADVYLAEHIHLETQAAVKVLSIRLTNDHVEQFRTEARTVARLVHPHIVRVLDFGVEDHTPYLAMDYAPNGSLRQLHPKGTRLPIAPIVSYVKQVAESLQYAHEKKLIHRDIKPENMLRGEKHQVLLSDFGIALVAQSTRYQDTQEVIGTAAYMAPEQLQGKPRRASDQYSLGIVVYEWLCGDRPFHGSFTEIYSQHMFVPPPSLCERVPEIPSAVEEVVFTALAKDPQQRFASVQEFAATLEQTYRALLQRNTARPSTQSLSHTVMDVPSNQSPVQPQADTRSRASAPSPRPPIKPTSDIQPTLIRPPIQPAGAPSPSNAGFHSRIRSLKDPISVTNLENKLTITNRHGNLALSTAILLIGLAFLIVVGNVGLLYTIMNNHIAAANATATTSAYAEAKARAHISATANAQATANVYASATANAQVANAHAYVSGTANGVMFGFDAQHTSFNPYENVLTPTNVSNLVLDWTASAVVLQNCWCSGKLCFYSRTPEECSS